MHVDAEHFGLHKERASHDWLDEGVLAKILSAFSRDRSRPNFEFDRSADWRSER